MVIRIGTFVFVKVHQRRLITFGIREQKELAHSLPLVKKAMKRDGESSSLNAK